MKKWLLTLLVTLGISSVLLTIGFASKDPGVLGNMIILSTFVVFIPQVYLRYEKLREEKEILSKFPEFLRDLAENIRSGMTLADAIYSLKRKDYGSLSKFIKRMGVQLSWKIPVEKVLKNFEKELNNKVLKRSVETIIETNKIGGDLPSTLDSLSDSILLLQEAEKEKSSVLSQYVTLMYGISIIFVGIVIAIIKFLVPIFQTSLGANQEIFTNPCDSCIGFGCTICELYNLIGQTIFFLEPYSPSSYYVSMLFIVSMVQAFFSGLIAGVATENSVTAGLKHSVLLCGIVFGIFSIVVRIGILGV